MGRFANAFGPHAPAATYIGHSVPEKLYDTGEVHLNYATRRRRESSGNFADSGPDRVVVGL
jgi:hypothetical protein